MTDEPEIAFSALDAPAARGRASYALPLSEWNEMVALANHLAKREAEMPLRRRMQSFLTASNQAYSSPYGDDADRLSYDDEDQGKGWKQSDREREPGRSPDKPNWLPIDDRFQQR